MHPAKLLVLLFFTWALLPLAPAHGASMDPGLLPIVQAATFEVVAAKPANDPLSYARELPLDLLPYQQRNDKYYSIGTAFAIGPNRYVTAAHVLMPGLDSLWGPPSLRDSAGRVYAIDQIEKFSLRRDFIVFSLIDPPAGRSYPINARPALNQVVYAVGNALGTGVVIRDGLYTSDTPEDLSGSWSWMRFSAAASPGNSGGPLLDAKGRVIGVVLMKSANENLNFALPIGEVLDAPAGKAAIEERISYGFPVLQRTLHDIFAAEFDLPLGLADFFATYNRHFQAWTDAELEKLLAMDPEAMFPNGPHSQTLLHNNVRMTNYPSLVTQSDNGDWRLSSPNQNRIKLDDNGYIEIGTHKQHEILFHLRRPDSIDADTLYHDAATLMDQIAATGYLQRQVGSDKVQITSLGTPATDTVFTDRWQRPWQIRTWPVPYQNAIAMVMALPVPDGYVGVMNLAPAGQAHDYLANLRALADFMYVTYDGSLAQWQDFLRQDTLLPKAFQSIRIDIDYGKRLHYRSPRFDLAWTPKLQDIEPDSMLTLGFSFFRDGPSVVWDVADVWAAPNPWDSDAINVARRTRPPADADDRQQSAWNKLAERRHPHNGVAWLDRDVMKINATAGPPASAEPDVLYALYCHRDGSRSQRSMAAQMKLLQQALVIHP